MLPSARRSSTMESMVEVTSLISSLSQPKMCLSRGLFVLDMSGASKLYSN